ncbi:Sec1 domain-containing protein 2 [Saguinus oedipus]|uniref:Sec1 domain-containing protein 2 n=1 Tax=Saguinus oedipus TaxID=9490 RepID=A0ABQ9W275_SAGOE|nr:Sec1 domain-containing protein 2 [Saguinus oedipus]
MSASGVLSFTQQGWEQVLAKPALGLRIHSSPGGVGGGAKQPKAVFVLSRLLKGRTVEILRDIICRSHFQYCVVVTAVSHAVHLTANHVPAAAAAEMEGQQPVFEQLEEKLSWVMWTPLP